METNTVEEVRIPCEHGSTNCKSDLGFLEFPLVIFAFATVVWALGKGYR